MRQALPRISIEKLKEPEFSHGETLQITGLTADTLLTWHKRGLVPNVGEREQGGRGHRRKYSAVDLAYLMVLKGLAGRMSLVMAGMAAANAVPCIIAAFAMLRYTETSEDYDAMNSLLLVAYEDHSGQTKFEMFTDQEGEGLPVLPDGRIDKWMRSLHIQSATVLDIPAITLTLFGRIGDVKEARRSARNSD